MAKTFDERLQEIIAIKNKDKSKPPKKKFNIVKEGAKIRIEKIVNS